MAPMAPIGLSCRLSSCGRAYLPGIPVPSPPSPVLPAVVLWPGIPPHGPHGPSCRLSSCGRAYLPGIPSRLPMAKKPHVPAAYRAHKKEPRVASRPPCAAPGVVLVPPYRLPAGIFYFLRYWSIFRCRWSWRRRLPGSAFQRHLPLCRDSHRACRSVWLRQRRHRYWQMPR